MKKYFNQDEKDFWLITLLTTILLDDKTENNKNLTKEEVKKLKSASTLMKNSYKSASSRIEQKSQKQMTKYIKQNEIKVISKERSKIESNKLIGKLVVNADTLEKITSWVCSENCGNCKKDNSDCDLYQILDDFRMDGFNLYDNCPYAFIDKEKLELEKVETLPANEKMKKSKRHIKKHKNRYDEDTEEYEYNFKVKNVESR